MKKVLIAFGVVMLLVGMVPFTQAADFPDVSTAHPHYTAITFLHDRHVIDGYPDGTYKPEREITRAELLKILLRAAGYTEVTTPARDPFPDVDRNEVLAPYIEHAASLRIVNGYEDGLFRMNRTVSRIEALKMLLLTNHITAESLSPGSSFNDVPAGSWYEKFAKYAQDNHLVDTYPGNEMRINELLNRGSVAELVYRFYRNRPDLLPLLHTPAASVSPSIVPSATASPVVVTPTPTATPVVSPSPTATTHTLLPSFPSTFFTLPPTPTPAPSTVVTGVDRMQYRYCPSRFTSFSAHVYLSGPAGSPGGRLKYSWNYGGSFSSASLSTEYAPEAREVDLPAYVDSPSIYTLVRLHITEPSDYMTDYIAPTGGCS